MRIRESVLDAPPYNFSAAPAAVKLDQNESPYALPPVVAARVAQVTADVALNRYPQLQAFDLAAALAGRHEWDPAGVVVANGSNTILQGLVIAAGIGRRVVTVVPTFPVYAQQAQLLGAELVEVPLERGSFALPVDVLAERLAHGRGLLVLANPAAPTGNWHPEDEIVRLIEAAGDRYLIAIDEAYQAFAGTDLSHLARMPGVVVVRTLSKSAGLAGLRLGYALCAPDLATQLRKTVMPFSVSTLQQAVAGVVLEHDELLDARVAEIRSERERLHAALTEVPGVEAFPSSTNFVLFRTGDAAGVHRGLLDAGILVRRQDHLPGLAGCLRVSVGLPEENRRFLEALGRVLASGAGVPA